MQEKNSAGGQGGLGSCYIAIPLAVARTAVIPVETKARYATPDRNYHRERERESCVRKTNGMKEKQTHEPNKIKMIAKGPSYSMNQDQKNSSFLRWRAMIFIKI